jgi:hypothetical protein
VSREAEILQAIDEFAAALARFRAELAALVPPPAVNGAGDADDLADGSLLDTTSAAARFGYPQDTIRKWCRTEDLGVMRGGRWLVSIPRLQRRLNGK